MNDHPEHAPETIPFPDVEGANDKTIELSDDHNENLDRVADMIVAFRQSSLGQRLQDWMDQKDTEELDELLRADDASVLKKIVEFLGKTTTPPLALLRGEPRRDFLIQLARFGIIDVDEERISRMREPNKKLVQVTPNKIWQIAGTAVGAPELGAIMKMVKELSTRGEEAQDQIRALVAIRMHAEDARKAELGTIVEQFDESDTGRIAA